MNQVMMSSMHNSNTMIANQNMQNQSLRNNLSLMSSSNNPNVNQGCMSDHKIRGDHNDPMILVVIVICCLIMLIGFIYNSKG